MKLALFAAAAAVASLAYLHGHAALAQDEGDAYDEDFEGGEGYDEGGYDGGYDGYGGDDYGMGGMGGGGSEPGPEAHITGVIDLDDKTWGKVIDGRVAVFAEFYAPWCGHCKEFKDTYAEVAEEMADNDKVLLVKVDAEESTELAERFGIGGFPTIMFFPKGVTDAEGAETYEGERTAEAVIDFLEGKVGGAGQLEVFAGAVDKFKTGDKKGALADAEKIAAGVAEADAVPAKAYVKTMTNMIKSDDYAKKEFERLGRLLDSGSVKEDKIAEFKKRRNVLRLFHDPEEL